jgi:LCP family protein required for cell wall assembly
MKRTILKSVVVAFALFFVVLLLGLGWVGIKLQTYLNTFTKETGVSFEQWKEKIQQGFTKEVPSKDGITYLLLLGSDETEGRPAGDQGKGILTDSIMLFALKPTNGEVATISIPRDLWVDTYKTKVNALYSYGIEQNAEDPVAFPKKVFGEMFDTTIHYGVVLHLKGVADLIDALGGINVEVERGFTDTKFPRSGVDVATERDPAKLFQTITFEKGIERMTGERALQFIRSRQSESEDEGTDDARVARQQKVMQALFTSLFSKQTFANPKKPAALYTLYAKEYEKNLPLQDLIAIAHAFTKPWIQAKTIPNSPIKFRQHTLSIQENGVGGVLYHPTVRQAGNQYGGQWVYLPIDASWAGVRQELHEVLENE